MFVSIRQLTHILLRQSADNLGRVEIRHAEGCDQCEQEEREREKRRYIVKETQNKKTRYFQIDILDLKLPIKRIQVLITSAVGAVLREEMWRN